MLMSNINGKNPVVFIITGDFNATAMDRIFEKKLFSYEIAHYRKILISIFQQFLASMNKMFILEGRLGTRIQFVVFQDFPDLS